MKAGVGYANDADARVAGRSAAAAALRHGGIRAPTLALAFSAGDHDGPQFLEGVREALGPGVPVLGGSAIGVVTGEVLSYAGHPAAVAVLELDAPLPAFAAADRLNEDERAAGRLLGRRLAEARRGPADLLLLFYDSVRAPPSASAPPIMNASRPLIAGMSEGLPGCPPVVGAGLLGDPKFGPTWQYCGDAAGRQRAAGVLLGPETRPNVQIMHGCTPMDGVPHRLGRVEAGVVHEIDGLPAAAVLDEVYGGADWRAQRPVNRITLGVRHGPRDGADEDAYVNRLVTGVMPDGRSIGLFEPDLEEGEEVLFMLRDPDLMAESARRGSEAAIERMRASGATPRFALYVDCAGRASQLSRTVEEEAAEVQAVMRRHGVPLLGFYSGVEIAPVKGVSRGLDWTGVLLLLGDG